MRVSSMPQQLFRNDKVNRDTVSKQTLWVNGAVGDRLTALRDDEVYLSSSHSLVNLIPTELGNLAVMKSFAIMDGDKTGMINPIMTTTTKYGFSIVATETKIYTISDDTGEILFSKEYEESKTITRSVNVRLISNYLFVCAGTYTDIYEVETSTGEIALSLFKDSLIYPVEFQEDIVGELYQVRDYSGTPTPYRVSVLDNPTLEQKGGSLYVGNSDYKITRIYIPYQSDLSSETIPGLVEGEWILVLQPFSESTDSNYYLDNTSFTFTGKTSDVSGEYYINTDLADGVSGDLTYGQTIDISDSMIDVTEYDGRLAVLLDKLLVFSEVNDFNNFRNGVNTTDPFFFYPSPIKNIEPTYLKFVTGRGLYTITDRGVYVTGYDESIYPTSIPHRVISDEPATVEAVELDSDLYFINPEGNLKAVQDVSSVTGVVEFKTFDAEKFALKQKWDRLHLLRIKSRTYVVASSSAKDYVSAYRKLDLNRFARVEMDITEYVSGINFVTSNKTIVTDEAFYYPTDNNMYWSRIIQNPPFAKTPQGHTLPMDIESRYNRIDIKFLDEVEYDSEGEKTGSAIEKVVLNDLTFDKLGDDKSGIYSVYRRDLTIGFTTKVILDIYSNQNDLTLEVQAVESSYTQRGD